MFRTTVGWKQRSAPEYARLHLSSSHCITSCGINARSRLGYSTASSSQSCHMAWRALSSLSLKYTALSSLWSIACRSSWHFCQAEEVPHHHTQDGQAGDFLYIYPMPPHSASCTSASKVCAPVAGGKNTISTSCSRC